MASNHTTNPMLQEKDPARICRYLRTKGFYLDGLDDPDMHTSGPEAHYWCLQSMNAFGPDGDFVCPEDCSPQRSCFLNHDTKNLS